MPNVLIIGGRGRIGSGLRTYLPQLDPTYQFASIDLPNATDYAPTLDIEQNFVDCNISEHPDKLYEYPYPRYTQPGQTA